ncbi:nucleoside:proton symporter [Rhodovastum atsumiense]|uniref:Nucleoside:proton symporter n=2 Tax=Rhodovastum atsumiense TaxID=504468 RepID=A0A5M6J2G1_9PROT|nr:nucleoside:proton symporter [Rhodovastum atsumiense]
METLRPVLGIGALLLLAWILSENRRDVRLRPVLGGLALQVALAVLLLFLPPVQQAMLAVNDAAEALNRATNAGTRFVFGYLAGPPLPFAEAQPGGAFILAFQALPLVLTISALATLLFHWGVLQAVMRGFAWLLRRTLGVGGALALGAAVHVFVGMVEAPLLVRPWLARMARGELFALMTCGMAGIAGTVMIIYGTVLGAVIPNALGNVISAAIISTPAAIAVAALMIPFDAGREDRAELVLPDPPHDSLDAILKGIAAGIPILVSILAVLLVTVALVTLANMVLGLLPAIDGAPVTLQRILALPFRPVVWLIGIPWAESGVAAQLMATKTVLNEFVAYLGLAGLPPDALSPQSRLILTYAMCGFANFGSVGIMVGGISAMVPERREEVVRLGLRSLVSGTIATCTSGALAGLLAG